ncbi:phosphate ABC transporter ATP-binding protein PstB [Xanthocytophaga flava]|uniref:phosphate ABC transporter ATP-binding protein PstB n=1 Tax=Xanthocytophaga flava TaxID=3048013 RepID=UPI0028D79F26|nr:phosphate ABC transporter ATP-binding protein PstB [Xanthocytophaga flavus]MDJ1470301.1 phosphate ABC transporter ATP-binding protein PstB [Xanthocytophaga flavus]
MQSQHSFPASEPAANVSEKVQKQGQTQTYGQVHQPDPSQTALTTPFIDVQNLSFFYGQKQALTAISMQITAKKITALIGPSGCGKSTFLRLLNRMNDLIDGVRIEGQILLEGQNIYDKHYDVYQLRKKVGMVFQKPNPFPKSIFENVAYGLRITNSLSRNDINQIVERSLIQAGLWGEVKDSLHKSALALSGGQQQRLCIARALAIEPAVLLMDEPTSALDPIATETIEQMVKELKQSYTIIVVTHNMQQAMRISDETAFFYMGELVEFQDTEQLFYSPKNDKTQHYVNGKFG